MDFAALLPTMSKRKEIISIIRTAPTGVTEFDSAICNCWLWCTPNTWKPTYVTSSKWESLKTRESERRTPMLSLVWITVLFHFEVGLRLYMMPIQMLVLPPSHPLQDYYTFSKWTIHFIRLIRMPQLWMGGPYARIHHTSNAKKSPIQVLYIPILVTSLGVNKRDIWCQLMVDVNERCFILVHRLKLIIVAIKATRQGCRKQLVFLERLSKGRFTLRTMKSDHGRWPSLMVRLGCPTFMIRFFPKPLYRFFGPLTTCKPNVDQEEWPCTKKWMCWLFLIHAQKGQFWKNKTNQVWPFSCLLVGFTSLHFLLNVAKIWVANLLTTILTK